MGWTDNGKIMPPWITLSEQERQSGREGGRKTGQERDVSTERKPRRRKTFSKDSKSVQGIRWNKRREGKRNGWPESKEEEWKV